MTDNRAFNNNGDGESTRKIITIVRGKVKVKVKRFSSS